MLEDDTLRDEIEQLKKENEFFRTWQHEINQFMARMLTHMEETAIRKKQMLEALREYAMINRWRITNLPYEMNDPDFEWSFFKPKVLSVTETRQEIIMNGRSLARFGDGEFSIIGGVTRWNFQKSDPVLARRLEEVLSSKDEKLLIGINPFFYGYLGNLEEDHADGIRAYMQPEIRKQHERLLDKDRLYGDACFHTIKDEKDVEELKQIWDKRDCILVEGRYSRCGVGNDLLDNCNSISRILCPTENAFDRYDEIFEEICKQPKDKLILLVLGPTATVLAYDLCKAGYQAVDIGHLDLIYEEYCRGVDSLYEVNIPYKYCNNDEIVSGREIEDPTDDDYEGQIIARIY